MNKLFIYIKNPENINKFNRDNIEGFIVAEKKFSSSADDCDIEKAVSVIHEAGYKAYVKVDCLYQQFQLPELEGFLLKLDETGVDGIIYTDIGVFKLMNKLNVSFKGIYAPETLLTNWYDISDIRNDGIDNCVISKDITFDDVCYIADKCPDYCFIRIHGPILLAYSRRKYISSYLQKEADYLDGYFLQEETRDTRLPIIEKEYGSWLYGMTLQSIRTIRKLCQKEFAGFIIDNVIFDDEYTFKTAEIYSALMDNRISEEEAFCQLTDACQKTEYTGMDEIRETWLDKE
ncbi:MAG: U32 family peptidase [Erysipelotrichaceae bacterium]|nr:U32 family peptidase [Erysipelotrichaceae bacterium]